MSWASVAQAQQLWPGADQAPDPATLQLLLDASTERLEVFAPPHIDPLPPGSTRFVYANVLDAHDLWAWARDTGQDTAGLFDSPLTLDPPRSRTQVRQLLRPPRPAVLRG